MPSKCLLYINQTHTHTDRNPDKTGFASGKLLFQGWRKQSLRNFSGYWLVWRWCRRRRERRRRWGTEQLVHWDPPGSPSRNGAAGRQRWWRWRRPLGRGQEQGRDGRAKQSVWRCAVPTRRARRLHAAVAHEEAQRRHLRQRRGEGGVPARPGHFSECCFHLYAQYDSIYVNGAPVWVLIPFCTATSVTVHGRTEALHGGGLITWFLLCVDEAHV